MLRPAIAVLCVANVRANLMKTSVKMRTGFNRIRIQSSGGVIWFASINVHMQQTCPSSCDELIYHASDV